jgi:glycosyltransferase involved in cell wall biosynthesis
MISIIIPIYNQANKLSKTLLSLEKQTTQNFEVILINDGSNDQPDKVFAQFSKRSKAKGGLFYYSQENQGAPAARNFGFKKSQGEFIFFCDADTILRPHALETLRDALEFKLKASFSYSDFKWGRKTFKTGEFSASRLKKEPYIHTMSLIRRDDFSDFSWDESLKKFQDWDLWLSMSKKGKFGVYVNKILFSVIPGGHISSWLPAFAYKYLTWLPAVKKYHKAKEIILKKHDLV